MIIFDDMIPDINTNKNFQAIIRELLFRRRKLNRCLVFITQSYFSVPNKVRLNSTHYLVIKIHNKRETKNIAIHHSADIDYKKFINTNRKFTSKPYSFFTIDTTLPTDRPLRFRKKILDSL